VFAVDFGTVNTVAAVGDVHGVRPLTINGRAVMPSAVVLEERGGWLVGELAINAARRNLAWFEATPKSLIPSGSVFLGGRSIPVADTVAEVLRYVADEADEQHASRPPERFVVTHPAGWADYRIKLLLAAADKATNGTWPKPEALAEPVAAVQGVLGVADVTSPGRIVVLDLGGVAVKVAVVDWDGPRLDLVSSSEGHDAVSGEDFDLRVARLMVAEVDAGGLFDELCLSDKASDRELALDIRVLARTVKEQLSVDTFVSSAVPVPTPDGPENRPVQISRNQLEELIKGGDGGPPGLTEAVQLAVAARDNAPAGPPFAGVLLVGGSSRIPLLGGLLQKEIGQPPLSGGDPGTAVAHGAAIYALSAPPPEEVPASAARLASMASRTTTSPGGVFISYRREDDHWFAGRLYDRLKQSFGEDQVFMDVDSIEYGIDFVEELDRALSRCSVLLAVIGPRWIAAVNEDGEPRLNDPDDFVRLEIERALICPDVRVIPILLDSASMPKSAQLPESLQPLRRRNACLMSHTSFGSDCIELVATIERIFSVGSKNP
jgi:molecular chaperone DnaK (HSP70)